MKLYECKKYSKKLIIRKRGQIFGLLNAFNWEFGKNKNNKKSTVPDDSVLPKSCLGVSQHEKEIRKAMWLHISHNTGHNKNEWISWY